jgi:hypothetical protein
VLQPRSITPSNGKSTRARKKPDENNLFKNAGRQIYTPKLWENNPGLTTLAEQATVQQQ